MNIEHLKTGYWSMLFIFTHKNFYITQLHPSWLRHHHSPSLRHDINSFYVLYLTNETTIPIGRMRSIVSLSPARSSSRFIIVLLHFQETCITREKMDAQVMMLYWSDAYVMTNIVHCYTKVIKGAKLTRRFKRNQCAA